MNLNKFARLACAVSLLAPSPALAGSLAKAPSPAPAAAIVRPTVDALAPLPVISALSPLAAKAPPPAIERPAAAALLPVLAAERPVEAVVPKVFEASTLDAAPAPILALGAHGPLRRAVRLEHAGHAGDGGEGGGPPRDPSKEISALKKALLISGGLIGVELVGGLTLESLALRADALHLTADWTLNLIALGAMIVARRGGASGRWARLEPVVGLISSLVIGYTAFEIGKEALARLASPEPFSAPLAILLALCGLAANGLATAILYKHRDGGLGVRSVFLHALTDAAGSLSVAVSSGLIWAFGWAWADPAASALIVLLISKTGLELGLESWKALRGARKR